MDERYTNSLIDSTYAYIRNLQYLARNDEATLKDLSVLKILHQLYDRADWYEVSEKNKSKLEKLINCVILHNSNITLPVITPGIYYSNVNTPQSIYTWQKLQGDTFNTLGPISRITYFLTINAINGTPGVPITVNTPDYYLVEEGTTSFTMTYEEDSLVRVTAPATLSSGNTFSRWLLDGVPQTSEQLFIDVSMETNHTITASYILYVEPVGTLKIEKSVLFEGSEVIDPTIFAVTITNGVTTWVRKFSQTTSVTLEDLPYGTYTITETASSLYNITSTNPTLITINESNVDVTVIIENTQKNNTGSITINKIVLFNSVEDPTDNTVFDLTLTGDTTYTETIAQNAPLVLTGVPFGTYAIEETANPEYEVTSIAPLAATISSENPDVVISIVNTRLDLKGSITLTKQVTLSGTVVQDGTTFTVTITGPETRTGDFAVRKPITFSNLTLGTYVVTETAVSTHTLEAVTPVTLTAESLNQSRTVVNAQVIIPPPIGSITIVKEVTYDSTPIADNTEFHIVLNGTVKGIVKVGVPLVFSNLAMGEYTLVENAVIGYTLGTVISPITLVEGNLDQTVNITNIKDSENLGSITINKNVLGITNVVDYGALYNWYTATDVRNIANTGAHVPSDAEFKTLEIYLGMSSTDANKFNLRGTDEGGKLKATGYTYWNAYNVGATNSSNFNAKGSGLRTFAGDFISFKNTFSMWLTDDYYGSGMERQLTKDFSTINRAPSPKKRGQSIRLLKDSTTLLDGQTGMYVGNDGKVYSTICIGTQEWLAEDLIETKFRNLDSIPIVTDVTTWSTTDTAAMCYYNNIDNTFHRGIGPILDDTVFSITITKDAVETTQTLTQDTPCIFTDIPLGTYTIEEVAISGYTPSIDYPEITLTLENLDQSVRVTNIKEAVLGNIAVFKKILFLSSKTAPGTATISSENPDFSFTITGTGNTPYTDTKIGNTTTPAIFTDIPEDLYVISETENLTYPLIEIVPETCIISAENLDQKIIAVNSVLNPTFGYGYLYNWNAVNNANSIAAKDWIVPSDEDYKVLISNYGGWLGGGSMKLPGYVYWNSPNINATNITGFNGVGAGLRNCTAPASFVDELIKGNFWAINSARTETPIQFGLNSTTGNLILFSEDSLGTAFTPTNYMNLGASLRLRKITTTLAEGKIGTYIGNDNTIYKTICIGGIEWIAENLKETKYRNGDTIPLVTDGTAWSNDTLGARCAYNNDLLKI